ncbi:MAG: MBL fold metallo-hydrolase [Acidimicrobiales bacterium]
MPGDRGLMLTVLGCAGSSFDAESRQPCSSYLIESAGAALLLDCGFGSFESLRALAPSVRLDAIVLSHAHRDHVADLESFLGTATQWRAEPRLIAARPTIESLAFDPRDSARAEFVVDGETVVSDGYAVECATTRHQIPTLAVQVNAGGARVVYGADSGPGWTVPASFRNADLAIIECTLETRDEQSSPYHLDAREVAQLVGELSPATTLLTHVPPGGSGVRRRELVREWAPNARVVLAERGLVIEL